MILRNFGVIARSLSMKAAAVKSPGGPEQLYIADIQRPEPKEKHILMKVYASAINRADILQRQGRYPPPPGESDVLGLEAAGIVESVGSGASKWKVGDRVMALLAGGGNAEYVSVHEGHLLSIPNNLSFTEAAAIPEVWLTAYQLLHLVGKAQKGETVLIHAAGSGVGTAAIQLAHDFGLKVYVTAGSQQKIELARGLGASAGCNYKEGNFAEHFKKLSAGRGVNLVLDCIAGSFWEQNCEVLGPDGRWVVYGSLGGVKVNGNLFAKVLQKRLTLTASTLRARSDEYKSLLVSSFTTDVLEGFTKGKFRPVVSEILPFSELARGHQIMESNTNAGKIVLEISSDIQKS